MLISLTNIFFASLGRFIRHPHFICSAHLVGLYFFTEIEYRQQVRQNQHW
jgi:hypothetical protein